VYGRDLIPTNFADYAKLAYKTDRFQDEPEERHFKKLSFGYFGEVGSLLSGLKKVSRDQLEATEQDQARSELGDSLWYLTNLALLCNVGGGQLAKLGEASLRFMLRESERRSQAAITLKQLDGLATVHERGLMARRDVLLRQLGAQAGALVSCRLEQLRQMPRWRREAIFGDSLAQLVVLCASFRLQLSSVAEANLTKIFDRWPADKGPNYVLPRRRGREFEQFPNEFTVKFEERQVGARRMVVQQIHGLNVGDPLTDNNHLGDGYRFHDIFHLSYLAHLGWSPVIRALLKLKRKSVPEVDENEDGARAIIIEEGIATWIFNDAKGRNHYRHITHGRLDLAILQQVRSMVQDFEVKDAPLWQWENAILDGFRVFRLLLANKGGEVHINIRKHLVEYKPLARGSAK
jgi:NTP pyrophosphatase (non-canonical NTP hydrolase)